MNLMRADYVLSSRLSTAEAIVLLVVCSVEIPSGEIR